MPFDGDCPLVSDVVCMSMVSLPSSSDSSLRVVFSLPPRNSVESQFPIIVSALSLYMDFSCDCACRIMAADISLLLIVAMSLSKFGICPILLNSSKSSLTCIGSLPPYTSSALSQSRLNNCVYIMAATKLKVLSVSDIITNSAVFLSPMVSSPSSSYSMRSRSSLMSKGDSLAPQDTRMDFAVFPVTLCQGLFYYHNSKMREKPMK